MGRRSERARPFLPSAPPLWTGTDEPLALWFAQLPYCRALLKEVLRWRPVAVLGGTPHASTEDDIYDGYRIPKGSTILCNTWAIHRDPAYFPEPDLFRPERYIEDPRESGAMPYPQKAGHSAFGWGRRICPGELAAPRRPSFPSSSSFCAGMHVAERGLWIAIVHIVHHFTLETPAGAPKPDIFAFTDGFNSKAEPFPVKATLRGGEEKRKLLAREKEEAWEALREQRSCCVNRSTVLTFEPALAEAYEV